MAELIIEGTEYSPEVIFSPKNQQYIISGWSRPESPIKFFEPVFRWIDEQGMEFLHNATINFNIEYYNTPSAKMLKFLLDKLNALYNKGVMMKIVWHYDDAESKEEFEFELGQGLSFPIKYVEKEQ
jgi:hypothetical protein